MGMERGRRQKYSTSPMDELASNSVRVPAFGAIPMACAKIMDGVSVLDTGRGLLEAHLSESTIHAISSVGLANSDISHQALEQLFGDHRDCVVAVDCEFQQERLDA